MTGICFYFEDSDTDVWSGKNLDAWNYAMKVAGDIDSLIVVNKTDQAIKSPDRRLNFEVVTELPQLNNACYFTPPWHESSPLWDFDHNIDWYVFGPASGWGANIPGDLMINIPQAGLGDVHSVHAATTVMFHRYHVRNT